jgi:phage recombination protein Bet
MTTDQNTTNNTSTVAVSTMDKPVSYAPFGATDQSYMIELTISMVINIIATPTKSGKRPSRIDAIKFIKKCQAKQLDPWQDEAYLVGYDTLDRNSNTYVAQFSIITAHAVFLKRAEANKNYNGMQSGVLVWDPHEKKLLEIETDFHMPDQEVLGGWAKVFRKDQEYPTYRRAKLSSFGKDSQFWKRDTAAMICKCAEADALRSAFPSTLGNLHVQQEIEAGVDSASRIAAPSFAGDKRKVLEEAKREHLSSREEYLPQEDEKPVEVEVRPRKTRKTETVKTAAPPPPPEPEPEVEVEPEPEPDVQETPGDPEEAAGPMFQLAQALGDAGISFEMFMQWAGKMRQIKDADSYGSWEDVPVAQIQKWLNSINGIIPAIKRSMENGKK